MPKENFDLKKEISIHTAWITHDIHSLGKRQQVKKELAEHLEEAVYHHMLQGCSERDAFHIACEEMGDPKKLQRLFAVVHNREPSKWIGRLVMTTVVTVSAIILHIVPKIDLTYVIQSWLIFISQLIFMTVTVLFIMKESKYIRAFCKRISLISRLKKLCKEKKFFFHCTPTAYTDLDNKTNTPSFFVQVNGQIIAIRFTACLKKKRYLYIY